MKRPIFITFVVALLLTQYSVQSTTTTWRRAIGPWAWSFPRDHGAHPEFQSEWWYFTGNLEDEKGHPFGYQLTIFREGLFREPAQKESRWAMRDLYFGHFTISDVAASKFRFCERVDRGALGLAGSSDKQMEVHLLDWTISSTPGQPDSFHLLASNGADSIDFTVTARRPLILEGINGLSQKAPEPGNASYYYSYPLLETRGTLIGAGVGHVVHGSSWFDHEFSSSSLGERQVGWDWFSLQLDSGQQLMLYCLRRKDGTWEATSRGSWITQENGKQDVNPGDFTVENLAFWTSPHSAARYPAKWRIRIPSRQLDLLVEPRIPDQELRLDQMGTIDYWEGACRVSGHYGSNAVSGVGYTELTGYAQPLRH